MQKITKPSILIMARHYPFQYPLRDTGAATAATPLTTPLDGATKYMTARLNRDLAHDLVAAGWDVTVLAVAGAKTRKLGATFLKDGEVNVVRVPVRGRKHYMGFLKIWFALYKASLKLNRRDVVLSVSDTPFLAIAGARAAKQKQSSHINWCHEILPDLWPYMGYKLPAFVTRWLDRHHMDALKAADHVVVAGRCMREHLVYKGVSDKHISVIPPWANADPGGSVTDDLAQDNPTPRHVDHTILFRVMYTGTINAAMPVSPLLDVAMSITKEYNDIEFVFVGEGIAFEKISALKARHGLDRIKLLPPPPHHHAATMMASADVHVVTLKPEATGLIVPSSFYTAMASHRPVVCIASDQSEMARLLSEYPFGDVVVHDDQNRLRETILKYRHDRHEWFNAHQAGITAHAKLNHDTARGDWLRIIKSSFKPIL